MKTRLEKIEKDLEKAGEGRRVPDQSPGTGKAESGGREQPDRAGSAPMKLTPAELLAFLITKDICRFGPDWPEVR